MKRGWVATLHILWFWAMGSVIVLELKDVCEKGMIKLLPSLQNIWAKRMQ